MPNKQLNLSNAWCCLLLNPNAMWCECDVINSKGTKEQAKWSFL